MKITEAKAVLLAVIGGKKGHGFCLHTKDVTFEQKVPMLLRKMADEIEAKMNN